MPRSSLSDRHTPDFYRSSLSRASLGKGSLGRFSVATDDISAGGSVATRHWVNSVSDIYGPDEIEELLQDINRLELATFDKEAFERHEFEIDGSQVGELELVSCRQAQNPTGGAGVYVDSHDLLLGLREDEADCGEDGPMGDDPPSPTHSVRSWDSHTHYQQFKDPPEDYGWVGGHSGHLIRPLQAAVCYCDIGVLRTNKTLLRILVLITSVACFTSLLSGGTPRVSLTILPHVGKLRLLVVVSIFTSLFSVLVVFLNISHLHALLPMDYGKMQFVIYLLLGLMFLLSSSFVLYVITSISTDSQYSWVPASTRHSLIASTVLGYICSLEVLLCSFQSYRAVKYEKMEESSTNFTLHDTATAASRAVTADSIGPPRPHPPPAPRPIVRSQAAANRAAAGHHTADLMNLTNQNYRPGPAGGVGRNDRPGGAYGQQQLQYPSSQQQSSQHVVRYQLNSDNSDLIVETTHNPRHHPMGVDERLAAVLLKGSASPDSPPLSSSGQYLPPEARFINRPLRSDVGFMNRPLGERFTNANPQPDSFYDFRPNTESPLSPEMDGDDNILYPRWDAHTAILHANNSLATGSGLVNVHMEDITDPALSPERPKPDTLQPLLEEKAGSDLGPGWHTEDSSDRPTWHSNNGGFSSLRDEVANSVEGSSGGSFVRNEAVSMPVVDQRTKNDLVEYGQNGDAQNALPISDSFQCVVNNNNNSSLNSNLTSTSDIADKNVNHSFEGKREWGQPAAADSRHQPPSVNNISSSSRSHRTTAPSVMDPTRANHSKVVDHGLHDPDDAASAGFSDDAAVGLSNNDPHERIRQYENEYEYEVDYDDDDEDDDCDDDDEEEVSGNNHSILRQNRHKDAGSVSGRDKAFAAGISRYQVATATHERFHSVQYPSKETGAIPKHSGAPSSLSGLRQKKRRRRKRRELGGGGNHSAFAGEDHGSDSMPSPANPDQPIVNDVIPHTGRGSMSSPTHPDHIVAIPMDEMPPTVNNNNNNNSSSKSNSKSKSFASYSTQCS